MLILIWRGSNTSPRTYFCHTTPFHSFIAGIFNRNCYCCQIIYNVVFVIIEYLWTDVEKKITKKRILIRRRASHFSIFVCQNWMKMAKLWPCQARAKVALAILGHRIAILATFFEIWPSNLFCQAFRPILTGKPIYNWIASSLAIWCNKNLQNSTKSPISQFAILRKLTLPFFSYSFQYFCMTNSTISINF